MSLTQKDVAKIAKLSRIAMADDEITRMTDELNGIFDWIEQLQSVDTENVPAMAGVGNNTLRMREDAITDGDVKDKVIANAPNEAFGCYVVPKVVE